GRTDMRKSIDGLMAIIRDTYKMDPFANAVYLFCGRKSNTIKALHFDKLSADFCYPHILYQGPYKTVTSGINRQKICG
ncbi:MAG: IS66 family insertion sequence element accessory protein TnpB, partial [Lachnospiraceae bacterium]|nr:IS66 family insertion sequence element accessory protein TnpB [Lachnospiraceae bacterium]